MILAKVKNAKVVNKATKSNNRDKLRKLIEFGRKKTSLSQTTLLSENLHFLPHQNQNT